jgi:hypothetical protein
MTTTTGRKVRADAKLEQLDDADVAATLAALPAGDFDAAATQRAKALAWSALARINPDIDRAAKLLVIVRKAERHAPAVRRLALEERKVALRERLAAERAAAAERRNGARREPSPAQNSPEERPNLPHPPGYSGMLRLEDTVGLGATEGPKREERADESAEATERSEGAEVAVKTQRSEDRSKGSEGANLCGPVMVDAGLTSKPV